MRQVDLNCDLGESFGAYTLGQDEKVLPLLSSANVACGWHGGDPMVMEQTLALAAQHGIAVGAHVGYPDLLGFGRRNMTISPEEAKAYTLYQLGALYAFIKAKGLSLQHVKPHGAFYNQAAKDKGLAEGLCEAIRSFDRELILLCPFGSVMEQTAGEMGLRVACEVFADRAYEADGSLVPRGKPGAVLEDQEQVLARVVRMVTEQTVTTIEGTELSIRCQSICVHGDNPQAVAFARKIRQGLIAEGIDIAPLAKLVP